MRDRSPSPQFVVPGSVEGFIRFLTTGPWAVGFGNRSFSSSGRLDTGWVQRSNEIRPAGRPKGLPGLLTGDLGKGRAKIILILAQTLKLYTGR